MTTKKTVNIPGHPGVRLKHLRKVLGFTRLRMAGRLEMSIGGYSKNESGLRYPSHATLSKLIREFNVSMDWLLFNRGPVYYQEKAAGPGEPGLKEQLEQSARRQQEMQAAHEKELQELAARRELKAEIREIVEAMEKDEVLYYEILAYFKRYRRDRQEGREEEKIK